MSIEENKKIVYGFYPEIINNNNDEATGNFLTDDFVRNGVQRGADG